MLFFIYARKSVFTGKGESVENQVDMARDYIYTKFPQATEEDLRVFVDEGFSAKNTDRPKFQEMLRQLHRDRPDYVVCYRLDRISRSVSDFSALIEDLNERSIAFVCIKEEFDTSRPMGKAMMYIASVFAQLERETIAERVRDNMLLLARTGRWLGGTPPTGFTSERTQDIIIDGKMKTSCKLRDCPGELPAVDLMFAAFLETHSVSAVSKRLIKQGVVSRTGKFYSLLGIKDILRNPVYCIADEAAWAYFNAKGAEVCFEKQECSAVHGLLSYNKRDYKKKNAPRQPVEKWIIAVGRHKGRVPGASWVAVQEILENNRPARQTSARMHNEYALLSGLIFCGSCGERMFAKHRSGGGPRERFDYICSSKLRGGAALCGCPNISGPEADGMVLNALRPYTAESADIYPLLDKLRQRMEKQQGQDPRIHMETQLKKCEEEASNLVTSLAKGNASAALVEKVNERIAALDGECRRLEEALARLNRRAHRQAEQELRLNSIAVALSHWNESLKDLPLYDQRALIRLLVKKLVWDGENLHMYLLEE